MIYVECRLITSRKKEFGVFLHYEFLKKKGGLPQICWNYDRNHKFGTMLKKYKLSQI